jgi:hypothetical protein
MRTKAQIVQELLDEKKITAEDAVVLLMSNKEKEYVYVPQPYPVYPYVPWSSGPIYVGDGLGTNPFVTYSAIAN